MYQIVLSNYITKIERNTQNTIHNLITFHSQFSTGTSRSEKDQKNIEKYCLGGGGLLGLLGIGQLDLSGDTIKVTTALACQSPATASGSFSASFRPSSAWNWTSRSVYFFHTIFGQIPEELSLQHLQLLQPSGRGCKGKMLNSTSGEL